MESNHRQLRGSLIAGGLWVLALIASFLMDRPVARALQESTIPGQLKDTGLAAMLKAPGHVWFTVLVVIGVTIFHSWRWRAGALVSVGAIVSGISGLVKWVAGRVRPFKVTDRAGDLLRLDFDPFINGIPGLWSTKNLCFPSGHATLAFATAQILAMLAPRWRWGFYAVATIVGLERILENAHYVSDIAAAAVLGVYGSKLAWWASDRVMKVIEPRTAGSEMGAGGARGDLVAAPGTSGKG